MRKGGAQESDIIVQREIFVSNRKEAIEEFRRQLISKNKFAKMAAIRYIIDQERFIVHITKNKHPVAKTKEEQKILDMLIVEARKAFGKEYEELRKELESYE